MALVVGTHELGPGDGVLEVHTYREGVAQKVGHDLILAVDDWSATVHVGEPGVPQSVDLRADPGSLRVLRGLHGAKPLSDSDRASIRENIAKRVLGSTPISFTSDEVAVSGGRLAVAGALTLAQNRRPASFVLDADDSGRVSGAIRLRQSDWGISPYRALMGALKVRDEVEVSLDLRLPVG